MNDSKKKYKDKVKKIQLDLFPTDEDIIAWLEDNKPVATYIKRLIREDMIKEEKKVCSEQ